MPAGGVVSLQLLQEACTAVPHKVHLVPEPCLACLQVSHLATSIIMHQWCYAVDIRYDCMCGCEEWYNL